MAAGDLIGYVSDEYDVALHGVVVEFEGEDGVHALRSTASGAIRGCLPPGRYRATLACHGHGSKRVDVELPAPGALRFRLLSERLAAYMWPRWSRVGERATAHVHAVEQYRMGLWRYGRTKRRLLDLGWKGEHGPRATMQVTPDGDWTTTGAGWGVVGYRGNAHHANDIVAPEPGGLLYLHVRTASGAFFGTPWVVAPAVPTAPIAVLASTNTWNAYNEYGGRSNYLSPAGLPPAPTVNARQDLKRYREPGEHAEWKLPDGAYPPLSFARPEPDNSVPEATVVTDPLPGFLSPSLAPAEWRLHGWLEREGFHYDLYADEQLHSGVLDLDAYRVLVLAGHPEYWSREMVQRVTAWTEAGGRLASLGGNGLNGEVEFVDPGRLRFLTYLGDGGPALGMPNPDDPEHPFDSRMHRSTGISEAALLGVTTTLAGFGTGAPYEVVAADHWVFEGTGLRPGELFGTASLSQRCAGASGWETDKRTLSTPAGTLLLARGTNPDGGGAEMTYRETMGNGAVFAVGSITYIASLLVDEQLSRMTANVLRRFLD